MRPKGIALKNHIRYVTKDIFCFHDNFFKTNYLHTYIYRTVHEKIRDFQCLLCGQTFGTKSSLHKHEVYHTGIKNFEVKHLRLSSNISFKALPQFFYLDIHAKRSLTEIFC